jgi:large subunit ribosomal protein L6e
VNPGYVIATRTSVSVKDLKLKAFKDSYFKKQSKSKKEGESDFFAGDEPKMAVVSDKRKEDQKTVDTALLAAIKEVDNLSAYLSSHFTLRKGDLPHKMKF